MERLNMLIVGHWYTSEPTYNLHDILSGVWKYCNFELFYTVLNLFCEVAHKNIVLIPHGT